MPRTTVLTGSVSLFLLLAMLGTLFVAPVAASPEIRRVPAQYSTIQAAINAANHGDIIQVASKIYHEHVVVNKSLTIVGEGSSTTIIDGSGTGIVVRINASDVEFRGFTVQNGGDYPYSSILLGRCLRNKIRDNIIRNSALGIELRRSNACIVAGNKIMNNSFAGIRIADSSNNIIHYNMIADNSWGVYIAAWDSLLYHNNLINNIFQAQDFGNGTIWDNGAEGNYWSDYKGKDLDGDGIGDTLLPHSGGMGVEDHYPLVEPWSPYRVFSGATYYVTTFSNSTLASFDFNRTLQKMSFKATSGASGFCNVTIPKEVLDGYLVVLIDNERVLPPTLTLTENATHSFLYFAYLSGTHAVKILGRGDVDGDGTIGKSDVEKLDLIYSCVEPFPCPPYDKNRPETYYPLMADINGDGKVTMADVGKLDLVYSGVL